MQEGKSEEQTNGASDKSEKEAVKRLEEGEEEVSERREMIRKTRLR